MKRNERKRKKPVTCRRNASHIHDILRLGLCRSAIACTSPTLDFLFFVTLFTSILFSCACIHHIRTRLVFTRAHISISIPLCVCNKFSVLILPGIDWEKVFLGIDTVWIPPKSWYLHFYLGLYLHVSAVFFPVLTVLSHIQHLPTQTWIIEFFAEFKCKKIWVLLNFIKTLSKTGEPFVCFLELHIVDKRFEMVSTTVTDCDRRLINVIFKFNLAETDNPFLCM